MLITLLGNWGKLSFWDLLFMLVSYAAVIFVTLPLHEMAHAFAADRLGDHTAKWNGRLTMNPLRHLDEMCIRDRIAVDQNEAAAAVIAQKPGGRINGQGCAAHNQHARLFDRLNGFGDGILVERFPV